MRENSKEIFIAIMYFFRQTGQFLTKSKSTTLGGNLDPFFLVAPLEIWDRIKKRKITVRFIGIFVPIIIYTIIQILALEKIIISKTIINVIKICICILVMIYVKNHISEIDIYKITKILSIGMAVFAIISLILRDNNVLWRFNDTINKYTTTRLQLFYLEPSELGFHVAILIIIQLSFLFTIKNKKDKKICIIYIGINTIILYMARPFGAIVILTISVLAMLIRNLFKQFTKEKMLLGILIGSILIVAVIFMYTNKSPIVMRMIDTINGNDSSNKYRVNLSLKVLERSFNDYHYLGCGFGNLNSSSFKENYTDLGITEVLANSYIYYIIEGGIFAIVTLTILVIYLIKYTFKEYSMMKIGLLIFLVAYQIFGGHFTSGLTWALYGIIISDCNENHSFIKKEEV